MGTLNMGPHQANALAAWNKAQRQNLEHIAMLKRQNMREEAKQAERFGIRFRGQGETGP